TIGRSSSPGMPDPSGFFAAAAVLFVVWRRCFMKRHALYQTAQPKNLASSERAPSMSTNVQPILPRVINKPAGLCVRIETANFHEICVARQRYRNQLRLSIQATVGSCEGPAVAVTEEQIQVVGCLIRSRTGADDVQANGSGSARRCESVEVGRRQQVLSLLG